METIGISKDGNVSISARLHSLEKLIEWKPSSAIIKVGVTGSLHSLEKLIEWKREHNLRESLRQNQSRLHSLEKLIEWKPILIT